MSTEYLGRAKPVNRVDPRVSVCVLTYNHVGFIGECLDSILNQRGGLPFEVLLGEDESSDGTREICKAYADEYCDRIRLFLRNEKEKFYINGHPTGRRNLVETLKAARGEYIALCDGDDYWTLMNKLAVQVEELDRHPDASGCFHPADDLDETRGELRPNRWSPPFRSSVYSLDDLLRQGNFVPTSSLVFRKASLGDPSALLTQIPHGDLILIATLLQSGDFRFIDKSMSVYRRHPGGIHSSIWGTISAFRSLRSRINLADQLDLHARDSHQGHLQELFSELENRIVSDQAKIERLETELARAKRSYDRARQSKFFRLGMTLQRFLRWTSS